VVAESMGDAMATETRAGGEEARDQGVTTMLANKSRDGDRVFIRVGGLGWPRLWCAGARRRIMRSGLGEG
jgi:hypothetical protein